jgi:hypothetical protein
MCEKAGAGYTPPAARLGAHHLASTAKKSMEVPLSISSYPPGHNTLDPHGQMNRHDWRTLAFAASVTSLTGLHCVFGVN